jgi:aryl-alcohol dehydrogenase-like predicted oxidoreductase
MKKVTIPNTDLLVSNICYGSTHMAFEDEAKYDECLDCYYDLGGNFIDTANIYGKWLAHGKNSNEIMLGNWVEKRRVRNKIIIASKAAHPELASMDIPRMSYTEIIRDLEESLTALKTDYLDILWLHRDAENIPVETIIDMMLRIRESGKIRYFGCSNWKPERIKHAIDYAGKINVTGFIANQPQWSLAVPNASETDDKTLVRMDADGLGLHERAGLAAIPYSSQAGGFFTKYDDGAASEFLFKKYVNDDNLRVYENMKKISARTGYNCTQIALAYLLGHKFTTIPIIGSRTPEQIRGSVSASDIRLNGGDMKLLNVNN